MDAPPVARLLDLSGKVAVVTGAGGGLGRGIALRFAEAGAAVVVHYRRSADGAGAVVRRIRAGGGRACAVPADLAAEEGAAGLVSAAVEAFERLDILVNNAGAYPLAATLEMTAGEWDEVQGANLRSAFLGTQAAGRRMVAQGGGGSIVNVTSIEADRPGQAHSHYAAAKAGLAAYTRAAALELAPHGIRVNAVAPGLVWREGIEQAWPEGVARWRRAAPLGRLGTPEDVADACLFLASPASRWITGTSLTVDGGVTSTPAF
ncbi:MAG TPA: glucose 1-dehydrogenase [Vicinamibacteria bacterium]|nr:glucose 1-dehydrogenase [Vicinamibacteria bacterium]